jgi:hypothetical protein
MAIKTFTTGEVLTAADTNTYLGNAGLVYVNSKTFSGSGTVNFTSAFNSTYDYYKLIMVVTSADAGAQICESRLLVGSTATSGGTDYKYYESGLTWAGGADNGAGNGTAYWFIFRSTNYFMGTVEIQNPYTTNYTTYQSQSNDSDQRVQSGGVHTAATSYDGIQFKVATGTLTGTLYSYGYRKA